ncbi:SDR family NAD(P)-dependent oxidoreductase [Mycobacterium hubeiense]|uniref:SDR family NAD(P)-dependent oxidoreductase n=1 Tax=Mycobacterium hubeiense TaxID=1867256 RepID=UPI000C7ECEB2|nr:SDR family NAD(P)-dependent oxidoreductase [Mycobacterium sp. QGD 101]
MDSFEGRCAVITGGANGIGFATATEFGRRGARVMLADVDATGLERAVSQLQDQGIDARGVRCDVRTLDDVVALADDAFGTFGAVHVVFNNAGVAHAGPIAQVTHDDWRWVIDVDLWGPIHGVEAFLPRLLEQQEPSHLVFTSSFAGLVANVGLGPYSVAKYGVVALAESLSRELKPAGIGVSVLCPMIVDTDIMANSERSRAADYGAGTPPPADTAQLVSPSAKHDDSVLDVTDVARLTADAMLANRLYILPHSASRASIRRRFERIDRTFDEQAADGWSH